MFSRRIASLAFALWFSLLIVSAGARGECLLQSGDRVVFYGDSITQQRLYTRYVQQYLLVRYPELKLTFFNAGWGGDTAPGGLRRLDRDVLSLNPTVVTLFFGMNDGHYAPVTDATLHAYRDGMEGIIKTLTEKKIRLMVFTPGCVDYDRNKARADADYNKTLEALGDVAKELAEKYHCRFYDVIHPMMKFQAAQKAKDAKFTMIPDSVHPNPAGHEMMAHVMLQGLGAEPMPVLAEVDLAANTAKGAKIVSNAAGKVELATTGPALMAYWFDPSSGGVMQDSGYLDFAGPKLVVKGLAKGYYAAVDDQGRTFATGSAQQWADGIRLNGSASDAGKRLHDWIALKENNYFTAWREVKLGGGLPASSGAVYDSMMVADTAMAQVERDLSQPQPAGSRLTITFAGAGPNLALKKTYEVSDPNVYNWGIGGLTDGSWEPTNKNCFATGDKNTFPKTVTVDLMNVSQIDTVKFGVPAFGSTKTVTVSTSQDGKTYTEVGSHEFHQSAAEQYVCKFKASPARYVRLTYPDHYDQQVQYPATFIFTTELEAYAAEE